MLKSISPHSKKGEVNYFVPALIIAILVFLFYLSWSLQMQSESINKILTTLGFPVGWLGALVFIKNAIYIFFYPFLAYLVFMLLGSWFFSKIAPEIKEGSVWKGYSTLLGQYAAFFDSFFCLHLRKWEAGKEEGLDISWTDFITRRLFPFALIYTILFSIPVIGKVLEIVSGQFVAYLTAWFVSKIAFYGLIIISIMFFLFYLVVNLRDSSNRLWTLVKSIFYTGLFFAVWYFGVEYVLIHFFKTSSISIGTKITEFFVGILLSTFILTLELLILFVLIPFFIVFWVSIKGMYSLFREEFYAAPVIKTYRDIKKIQEVRKSTEEAVRGFEALRAAGRMTRGAASKKK